VFTNTKIALTIGIVLSTAVSASAATKPRATHVRRPAIYNVVPNYNTCPAWLVTAHNVSRGGA
jgi:hypothetical protein